MSKIDLPLAEVHLIYDAKRRHVGSDVELFEMEKYTSLWQVVLHFIQVGMKVQF